MATNAFRSSVSPLNIVHCVRAPIGGIFRNVLDLAEEQARLGHRVGLVLDSTTGGEFEARKIAEARRFFALGVTRSPMSRSVSPTDLAAGLRVYRTVRELAPDVLHGHGSKGGTFARLVGTALSRRDRPVARFYSPHGGVLHYSSRSVAGKVYFAVERFMERLCDGIIHVSRYEKDQYLEKIGVPRCDARVVVNGLRSEEFQPVEPNFDAVDFLVMGMVRELKGQDVFIRALALLRDRLGRQPSAAVIGDGPGREAFRQLATSLNLDVAFHDPKPTREGFAMGRIMVLPSRAESMPYIVLESLAAQLPLIATNVGGLPEIFGDESASLVSAGDANALAAAMQQALTDPDQLAAQAVRLREQISSRFTVETMAASVENLYLEVLARADSAAVAPQGLQPAE